MPTFVFENVFYSVFFLPFVFVAFFVCLARPKWLTRRLCAALPLPPSSLWQAVPLPENERVFVSTSAVFPTRLDSTRVWILNAIISFAAVHCAPLPPAHTTPLVCCRTLRDFRYDCLKCFSWLTNELQNCLNMRARDIKHFVSYESASDSMQRDSTGYLAQLHSRPRPRPQPNRTEPNRTQAIRAASFSYRSSDLQPAESPSKKVGKNEREKKKRNISFDLCWAAFLAQFIKMSTVNFVFFFYKIHRYTIVYIERRINLRVSRFT